MKFLPTVEGICRGPRAELKTGLDNYDGRAPASNGLEEAPRAHSSVKCAKMAWSLLIEMVGIFEIPGERNCCHFVTILNQSDARARGEAGA